MKNLSTSLLLVLALALHACQKESILVPQNPSNDHANIVILGASTAAGTGANPIDSSWVNRLRSATASNPKKLNYFNLAVGGFTTYHALPTGSLTPQRPAPDTAKNITKALSLHPDLVMITFPGNDVANGYADEEILANYRSMARLLDSAGVAYIIFGNQPRDLADIQQRQRLKTLNDQIKATFGSRMNDYYDQLTDTAFKIKPAYAFGDDIHLNNSGHYLIQRTVMAHPIFQRVIQ